MSDQPAANRRIFLLSAVVFAALFADAKAQTLAVPLAEPTAGVERLDTVEVVAALQPAEDGPFLPDVEGAQIFAGKKTDNIDPNLLPQINNNNYRQVLATTPGMVLAEESTPLVSIGSRGFDPHRMQFMQVLKDGIPIHADMIGYPEAYYTPPIDAVDRIDGGGVVGLGVADHVGVDGNAVLENLHELHAVGIEAARADADERGRFLGQHHAGRGGEDLAVVVVVDLRQEVGVDVVGLLAGENLRALHIGEKRAILRRLECGNDLDGIEAFHAGGGFGEGNGQGLCLGVGEEGRKNNGAEEENSAVGGGLIAHGKRTCY